MKIYTRTGDQGITGVIGARIAKDSARIEAIGTVDELNSFIGLAVAQMSGERFADLREDLQQIQHELFDCGADLASVQTGGAASPQYRIGAHHAQRLEQQIDRYAAETTPLRRFILPGGSVIAAHLHVCRSVCRRAERRTVALGRVEDMNEHVRIYLNRLSDLLFTAARAACKREGAADVEYRS